MTMAQIDIVKDPKLQLTTITVKGETTAAEISKTILAHNKDQVTILILWDLSQATIEKLTVDDVHGFVGTASLFTQARKGGKTAVVVPTDLGFGMARIYDSLHEVGQSPVSHMTFRDKESALNWLLE
jgi:hypothetical protein